MIDINDRQLMQELSKMACDGAFRAVAEKAQKVAKDIPDDMSGRDALLLFAEMIMSTNAKAWPAGGEA